MRIEKIISRQVLDSRGNPTVEAELFSGGRSFKAIVPSGASTGKYEAVELRDKKNIYKGKSVLNAIENVHFISKKIRGMDVTKQREIDELMIGLDGTTNKSRLGANAILAVSMALSRAGAYASKMPLYRYIAKLSHNKKLILPVPFANVINGGKHAGGKLAMQEFMICPVGAKSFSEAARMTSETYHTLKDVVAEKYGKSAINVGDEGGFAPNLATAEEALSLIEKAINLAGFKNRVKMAMDPAASEFYKNSLYRLEKLYSDENLIKYYLKLIKRYPIVSLEDPFDQDDFSSYSSLMQKASIQIVGDDLLVTNVERIKIAAEKKLCNALLLKINQIGTISEAIDAANLAKKNRWEVMVSHRSGETEDTFIADFVVGLGVGQIKIGAPCRTERVAKYNQLLRIEEELGRNAHYHKF